MTMTTKAGTTTGAAAVMTMQSKLRFDPNSPEIKAYLEALSHQFVREGTMVAFPMCLPGMTTPIPHDESRVTALDINAAGQVYGGTSGRQAHLFGAAYHGLTGIVLDAGTPSGATSTAAICCGNVEKTGAIAFVNGTSGGRAVRVPHLELAEDWIQEWGLEPQALTDLGECVPGEAVVHAVALMDGKTIVGVTTRHLFTMDIESGKIGVVGEAPGRGRIVAARGSVFGQDDGAKLWRWDVDSGEISRAAIALPDGEWNGGMRWASDWQRGILFTADDAGRIYAFDGKGFRALGKAHLAPMGPMVVTPDGRIFGFCGDEMANMFVCDMTAGGPMNLGVAASVIEQRRYGYQFGDAVTGLDGELVFGEDDNSGHLWIYFPKIREAGAKAG